MHWRSASSGMLSLHRWRHNIFENDRRAFWSVRRSIPSAKRTWIKTERQQMWIFLKLKLIFRFCCFRGRYKARRRENRSCQKLDGDYKCKGVAEISRFCIILSEVRKNYGKIVKPLNDLLVEHLINNEGKGCSKGKSINNKKTSPYRGFGVSVNRKHELSLLKNWLHLRY